MLETPKNSGYQSVKISEIGQSAGREEISTLIDYLKRVSQKNWLKCITPYKMGEDIVSSLMKIKVHVLQIL